MTAPQDTPLPSPVARALGALRADEMRYATQAAQAQQLALELLQAAAAARREREAGQ